MEIQSSEPKEANTARPKIRNGWYSAGKRKIKANTSFNFELFGNMKDVCLNLGRCNTDDMIVYHS